MSEFFQTDLPRVVGNCAVASMVVCTVGVLFSRWPRWARPAQQHNILLLVCVCVLLIPLIQFALSSTAIGLVGAEGTEVLLANWIGPMAGLLWLLGSLYLAFRLVAGAMMLVRFRSSLPDSRDSRIAALLQQASEHVGLAQAPQLSMISRPIGPMVIGIRVPVIVMPRDLCHRLNDAQLLCVLTHECQHVLRRDTLTATVQQIAHCLYWWNPAFHLASRQMEAWRERDCDDSVASLPEVSAQYSSALLAVAQWSTGSSMGFGPQLALLSRKHDLIDRIGRYRASGGATKDSSGLRLVLVSVCIPAILLAACMPLFRHREATLDGIALPSHVAQPTPLRQSTSDLNTPPLLYLRMEGGDSSDGTELAMAIDRFREENCRGMIVDMRGVNLWSMDAKLQPPQWPGEMQLLDGLRQSETALTQSAIVVVLADDHDDTTAGVLRRMESENIPAVLLSTPSLMGPLEFSAVTDPSMPEPNDQQLQLAINMLSHV